MLLHSRIFTIIYQIKRALQIRTFVLFPIAFPNILC
nr:MAG TPA: hypothetical protein [Caudoviricetes sp.]